MMTEVVELAKRVEQLERQNRRMRMGGGAVVAVLAAAVLMGQAAPEGEGTGKGTVEAEGFVLVDPEGKMRGAWRAGADGATLLSLYDRSEKMRGAWFIDADGRTGLSLHDRNEKMRVKWGVEAEGLTALNLFDEQERPRATLGSSKLRVSRTGTTEETAESSLILFDMNGKILWKAP